MINSLHSHEQSSLMQRMENRRHRRLTPAEERVFDLLRRGLSDKEIAGELSRAVPTIKHHVASILRKSGQPSRMRLIVAWYSTL